MTSDHLGTSVNTTPYAPGPLLPSMPGWTLRVVVRRGLPPGDDARAMGQWAHGGGFSVDCSVRLEAADRAGHELLLRYCARPAFALVRLRERDREHLIYPHRNRASAAVARNS